MFELVETIDYRGCIITIERDNIENYGYSERTKKNNPYVYSYSYKTDNYNASDGRVFVKKETAIVNAKYDIDNYLEKEEEPTSGKYYFDIEHKSTGGFMSVDYCEGIIKIGTDEVLKVPMKYHSACKNVCEFIVDKLNKLKYIENICQNNVEVLSDDILKVLKQ